MCGAVNCLAVFPEPKLADALAIPGTPPRSSTCLPSVGNCFAAHYASNHTHLAYRLIGNLGYKRKNLSYSARILEFSL